MKRQPQVALLATAVTALFSSTASAQCTLEELTSAAFFNPFGFGQNVTLSSERAVVTSFLNGEESFHVFDRVSTEWYPTEILTPRVGTNFNGVMDMDEDTVACGLGNDGTYGEVDPNAPSPSGEVDIFDLEAPGGFVKQTLLPSDAEIGMRFGAAISIDGDRMAIGAPGDSQLESSSGAVYIYERIAGSWQEVAKVHPETPEAFGSFGSKVKIDGDRMIVSGGFPNLIILPGIAPNPAPGNALFAPFNDTQTVYVFEQRLGEWYQTGELTGDRTRFNSFGRTMAISKNTIMVGALAGSGFFPIFGAPVLDPLLVIPPPPTPQPNFGAVFVYEKQGQEWVETGMLRDPQNMDVDNFGASLDLEGDYAVVGSPLSWTLEGSSRAYTYVRTADGWRKTSTLKPAVDSNIEDSFGTNVALTDHMAIVGAPNTMVNGSFAGKAYVFGVGEDCTGNGRPDSCDIMNGQASDTDGDMVPDNCETGGARPFCEGSENSLGLVSALDMDGESSLGMNHFALRVDNAAPSQFGVFLASTGDMRVPFGSGMKCVGGFQNAQFSAFSDETGHVMRSVDTNSALMGIAAYSSWNFQFAYRDGGEIHLTNAVEVTFVP